MRVTDEMVKAGVLAFRDSEGEINPACNYWSCVRNALEAALAAAPQPAWVEELAARWVGESGAMFASRELGEQMPDPDEVLAACAAELRARAKGET
jgi:hypothetical protein